MKVVSIVIVYGFCCFAVGGEFVVVAELLFVFASIYKHIGMLGMSQHKNLIDLIVIDFE